MFSFLFFYPRSCNGYQQAGCSLPSQPTAAAEEAQISHRLLQPPDLRARAQILPSEVPDAGRPGRARVDARPHQRPGHYLVPEQAGQAQT